jgi:hypothetical protein
MSLYVLSSLRFPIPPLKSLFLKHYMRSGVYLLLGLPAITLVAYYGFKGGSLVGVVPSINLTPNRLRYARQPPQDEESWRPGTAPGDTPGAASGRMINSMMSQASPLEKTMSGNGGFGPADFRSVDDFDSDDEDVPPPLPSPSFPRPPSYVHARSIDKLATNIKRPNSAGNAPAAARAQQQVTVVADEPDEDRCPSPELGTEEDMAEIREKSNTLFAPGARPSDWKS